MRVAVSIISLLAFCSTSAAQLANGLYAAIDTSMGGITCRLDYAEAPVTCANFAGLAEGSLNWVNPTTQAVQNDPFYEDRIFHRVVTNFVIQGGCPLGNGSSGPGYVFLDEFSTNLTHHSAGILSMANSGPDSNGSQFFITLRNTSHLDNKHSVFGEVVDGMDVVYAIEAVPTDGTSPLTDVIIHQIDILRIGTDAQNFNPAAQPIPKVTALPLSINNALEVSTAYITNHSYVVIYNSTNLHDWATHQSSYLAAGAAPWSEAPPSSGAQDYFKGTRIHYPQAVDVFTDVEGHTLTFSNASNTLVFEPAGGGTGTCTLDGTPDSIIFWTEGTSEPFFGRIFFQTAILLNGSPMQFSYTPDGTCTGYQYNPVTKGWNTIGEFVFTDAPPP